MQNNSPKFGELKRLIKSADTPRLQGAVRRRITDLMDSHQFSLSCIAEGLGLPLITKGRKNIALILELEEELKKKFPPLKEALVSTSFEIIDEVFLPPDEMEVLRGDGVGRFEKPDVYPRTELAIEVLKVMGVDLNQCKFLEGVNSPNMMRNLSYRMIVIPSLDKTVFVCDEEGNRTFVVFDADNHENYFRLQKSELKDLVESGMAMDFIWVDEDSWKERLAEALSMKSPKKRKKVKKNEATVPRPASINMSHAPDGWMTQNSLADELGIHSNTLKKLIEPFRGANSDELQEYKDGMGKPREYYSPKLVALVREAVSKKYPTVPDGWMTANSLINSLEITARAARELMDAYKEQHPEWFGEYKIQGMGGMAEFVAPEMAQIARAVCERTELHPEGWIKVSTLASRHGVAIKTVLTIADSLKDAYPGQRGYYRDKTMDLDEYMSPELSEAVIAVSDERMGPPKDWLNLRNIVAVTGRGYDALREFIAPYREPNPEWFRHYTFKGKNLEYYSPELVDIIRGQIEARPPRDWLTSTAIARNYNATRKLVASIINETIGNDPEAVREFQAAALQTTYYAPSFAALIGAKIEERRKRERPNEDWMTCGALRKELGVAHRTVQSMAEGHRETHPEWFAEYYTTQNIFAEHFAPELTQIIRDAIGSRQYAPEGWLCNKPLAEQIGVAKKTCVTMVESYRESHPEWFRLYYTEYGQELEFYAPELIVAVRQEAEKYGEKPDGYLNTSELADQLGVDFYTVQKFAESCRESNPEWFLRCRTNRGIIECLAPELIQRVKTEIEAVAVAPEGWTPNGRLAHELDVDNGTTRKIADEYRESHPEWFQLFKNEQGQRHEFFSPELVAIISDNLTNREAAPEGWLTMGALAKDLNVDAETIKNMVDPYREPNPEWFKRFKSASHYTEHYAPELIDIILDVLAARGAIPLAPEGSVTVGTLSAQHKVPYDILLNMARKYQREHPEWLVKCRTKINRVGLYVSAELVPILIEEIAKMSAFPPTPDGWIRMSELKKKAGIDESTLEGIIDSLQGDYERQAGIFEYKTRQTALHFGPEIVVKICELAAEYKRQRQMPEGWERIGSLGKRLSFESISKTPTVAAHRESRPEWFKTIRISPNLSYEYVSPELVKIMEEEIKRLDAVSEAPEGWMNNGGLARKLGTHETTVKKIAEIYREVYPEWFREYCYAKRKTSEFYAPELVRIITEKHEARLSVPEAPEGWICNYPLSKRLGVAQATTEKIADNYRESNPEWFTEFRDRTGKVSEHYSPELVEVIKKAISES